MPTLGNVFGDLCGAWRCCVSPGSADFCAISTDFERGILRPRKFFRNFRSEIRCKSHSQSIGRARKARKAWNQDHSRTRESGMPTHFLDLGLPPQGSAGAEFRAFRHDQQDGTAAVGAGTRRGGYYSGADRNWYSHSHSWSC